MFVKTEKPSVKNNKISRMNTTTTTTTTTKSSAEIVGSIDDLLIEILLRLPLKSLVHFELVSKHWFSLINNPEFRRLRNPFTNSAAGMFFPSATKDDYGMFLTDATDDDFVFEYVPFFPQNPTQLKDSPSGIRILNSCNGLMICESPTKDYFVYNPTTNHYSSPLPKLIDGINIRGMSLAFDPAKSPDHYKVVCVHRLIQLTDVGRYQYQIEIYSTEENPGVWRSSVVGPFIAYLDLSNGVYWNNAIHWIRVGGGDSMYFNVNHQVLQQMPNPPMSGRNRYFGESCDHLHYIQIYDSEIQFNIYEMKRDYSEWFVKYCVDLSPVASANPRMIPADLDLTRGYEYAFSLLSIVRGDQEEEDASFLVLQIPGAAIRYNIVSKTFQRLHEFGVVDRPEDFMKVKRIKGFQYIESLCSV